MKTEPVRFLVVDDIEENLVALEALLRRPGLEILTARSGAEALELLLLHDVALALLDVQMPEMDGFELAELMRGAERTKHVPIIFITAGSHDPRRVFRGYESGAVDFLFKPVEPHVLKSKTEVFLQLYRQRRELSDALRLSELFVGILGHDLRNPLAAIMTGFQYFDDALTDERERHMIRRMSASGKRMAEMIEQLLDLTRARLAGGQGFSRSLETVDVSSLVRRTVEELRVVHPSADLTISMTGECEAMGDPDRLLQLFSNIVGNALHHGAKGAPVAVTVRGTADAVEVAVHNGGAIPPSLLPVLFDPFRERSSSAPAPHGLGLGLFIAQQIAHAHQGTVSVQSSDAEGTRFTIRLPKRPLR